MYGHQQFGHDPHCGRENLKILKTLKIAASAAWGPETQKGPLSPPTDKGSIEGEMEMKAPKKWQGAPRPASLEVESRHAIGGGTKGRCRELRNKGENKFKY